MDREPSQVPSSRGGQHSVGPERPTAGGDDPFVHARPPDVPLVIDPVPPGMSVARVSLTDVTHGVGDTATLYGDPGLSDTLDGPTLLVGVSTGSAVVGGPRLTGPTVPLGDGTGHLVSDGDRTWVAGPGEAPDQVYYVVARGVPDADLIAAAAGADFGDPADSVAYPPTLADDAVPPALAPLVTGRPGDGPFSAAGEWVDLRTGGDVPAGDTWIRVSAVQASPRLAALWGFWAVDAGGTEIRGAAGSAGSLPGIILWSDAVGAVWAEDGLVISVIGTAGSDELVATVVDALRPGTPAEVLELQEQVVDGLV